MISRPVQLIAFIVLFAMAAIGFIELTDYSSRPGMTGLIPVDLELTDTSLGDQLVGNQRQSLLVFYHPKCPCTAASVRVLQRVHARCVEPPEITAVAYCPATSPADWIQSGTTSTLRSLGCNIVHDRGGRLARRFGVVVSGHMLLYGADDKLRFSGGVTPYRGHEGDSPSSADLVRQIDAESDSCSHWPVYGCTIIVDSDDDSTNDQVAGRKAE